MNAATTPLATVQAVARNIVPLIGILAFRWSAGNVLLLYLLDTLLSIAVIAAGLASSFAPPPNDQGVGGWVNSEASYVLVGLFVAALIAVPLGMPIGIVLAASGFSFREAFYDSSLRGGALVQTVLALWSYVGLYRALRTYSPTQLRLRQRFGLVFMRWIVVILVTYFIIDILPSSNLVLLLLVVAYIGASIAAEIAPDRLLRGTPADADEPAPHASATSQPTNHRASRSNDGRSQR